MSTVEVPDVPDPFLDDDLKPEAIAALVEADANKPDPKAQLLEFVQSPAGILAVASLLALIIIAKA